ncbi:Uncharacterised protein [uncultured archaeon]|nr:Uncharacterised protein [uncultured archaeon]
MVENSENYNTFKIVNIVLFSLAGLFFLVDFLPFAQYYTIWFLLPVSIAGLIISVTALKTEFVFDIIVLVSALFQLIPLLGVLGTIAGLILCILKIVKLVSLKEEKHKK